MAARLEDAARLTITLDLIGKEHRAELAGDDIKALILERQSERVGLAPGDGPIVSLPLRRAIKHRLIEIGCDNARLRGKPRCDRACENTGPRSPLPHIPPFTPHPLHTTLTPLP